MKQFANMVGMVVGTAAVLAIAACAMIGLAWYMVEAALFIVKLGHIIFDK